MQRTPHQFHLIRIVALFTVVVSLTSFSRTSVHTLAALPLYQELLEFFHGKTDSPPAVPDSYIEFQKRQRGEDSVWFVSWIQSLWTGDPAQNTEVNLQQPSIASSSSSASSSVSSTQELLPPTTKDPMAPVRCPIAECAFPPPGCSYRHDRFLENGCPVQCDVQCSFPVQEEGPGTSEESSSMSSEENQLTREQIDAIWREMQTKDAEQRQAVPTYEPSSMQELGTKWDWSTWGNDSAHNQSSEIGNAEAKAAPACGDGSCDAERGE
jgi:hypothetical protein